MLIAREKRKNNIAEYILYMWQVEDILRAGKFDISLIKRSIIDQYDQPPDIKHEITEWYAGLIAMMKEENITQRGHLQLVKARIADIEDLHQRLLVNPDEIKYHDQYHWAKPNIEAFRKKVGGAAISEMELCLTGLYAIILMRVQKRQVSDETIAAIDSFSKLLALNSQKYKLFEEGKLEL
ncbi:MAG: DUF4924 family protein [Bacteroidales bacterium]|nr:DUF4924 family protein [Bacteroidales bacterium]